MASVHEPVTGAQEARVAAEAGQHPVQVLAEVLDRAVELQPEAEAVIRACARPGETPTRLARDGGWVVGQYFLLHKQVEQLPVDRSLAQLHRRARELLAYHLELLGVCLNLAFPQYRDPKLEARRLSLDGLGPPAVQLRKLREELSRLLD